MALQKIELTPKIALEVAGHEAVILETYKDSVGVDTWSVGLTSASGHDVSRYIGKPSSLQHALNVFVWALRRYWREVLEAFEGYELSEAQAAAALSFHYNTGAIGRASWVKQFKAGERSKARVSFMAWNKPAEIVGRRKKERDLFFDGQWSNKSGTMTWYQHLTPKRTPQWSSAKVIYVDKEIAAAFAQSGATPLETKTLDEVVTVDQPSAPDNSAVKTTALSLIGTIIQALIFKWLRK